MAKRDEHSKERRIIEILTAGKDVPREELDKIRLWLAEDDRTGVRGEALANNISESLEYTNAPKEMMQLWPEIASRLGLEQKAFPERTIRPKVVPLTRRRLFRVTVASVAAAAVIAGVVLAPRFFDSGDAPYLPAQTSITAQTLKTELVILPDGSTVRLKGGSKLTYADNFAQNRAVGIDGEAFFSVTKDEAHPFTIDAGGITVEVLGTEFNVKAWSGGQTTEVTLAKGSVEVRVGEAVQVLQPAEKATIDRAIEVIELTRVEDSDMLRMQGINLSLLDVTLDNAFDMIADFYGVRITASADIPDIDGIVVRMDDGATLEQTLFMLQQINPVFDYNIEGDTVTITNKQQR